MRPKILSGPIAAATCLLLLTPLAGCGGAAPAARRNVVMITVDSLRADRPGFLGGSVETPSMDSIAAKGIVFSAAISPAPQTLPSLVSLHTGLYPPAHGVRDNGRSRVPDSARTLAKVLQEAGYATAAFAGALALHEKYGLSRGFATYAEAFADTPRPSVQPDLGVPAARIADRAIEWLGGVEAGKPFFLWVNFYDPHFFYEPPSPFREKHAAQPYDGEVAYVDREMGRLLRWLGDHGHDADTLVVLAGNHGEGLGDGGEQYHGILLRESTLRVPLVVRPAGSAGGSKVGDPVSLVDVAPTVLDLAGPGAAALGSVQGVSLAGYAGTGAKPDPSRPIYFETMMPKSLFGWAPLRGIRSGSLKYVEAPGTGSAALNDLGADPAEAADLSASRPDDLRRLAAEAARIGGALDARPAALPSDLADAIRSIGLKVDPPAVTPILPASKVEVGNAALQGHRSWQRRMGETAVFVLQDVLKSDPENLLALIDLAEMNMSAAGTSVRMRNTNQALQYVGQAQAYLRRAQERYPGDAEVYHVLGHFQYSMARPGAAEDLDKARVLFTTAARLAPLNEEALYDSACLTASRDQKVALDYLEEAVANGFRDWQQAARDPDLIPIRDTPRFREITGGRAVPPPAGTAAPAPGAPAPPAAAPRGN